VLALFVMLGLAGVVLVAAATALVTERIAGRSVEQPDAEI